ncbi:MAG TPA: cytochrome b5-like heme/steroid binding domain-containing protein [Candidatus Paceibacterota bacterium]
MNTRVLLAIITVVFVGVLGYGYFTLPQSGVTTSPAASADSQTTSNTNGAPTKSGYTMADVAKHNSASACWTAINGKVYDVTSWINQHPGGTQAILSLCGTDGSAAFNGQHGGQGRPASELASFLLGPLTH